MSNNEIKLIDIFRKENIQYIQEKTFPDLQGGRLRFDFYLPQLNILCEVDGQ